MSELSKNQKLAINLTAAFLALFINLAINFLLSPYIVKTIGVEANGFISLSTQIIGYISIFTMAINSMTNRFISISWFKGDKSTSNQYFSSAFYANIFFIILLILPFALSIYNLEKIINISENLVLDVKLLFLFVVCNFFITLLMSSFTVIYYIVNKLYINSLIQIFDYLLNGLLLWFLFAYFKPFVAYRGLVAFIIGIITFTWHIHFKRLLIPELILNKLFFDFNKIKELAKAGIWNSITRLGEVLSSGLDLFITNLFLDGKTMGLLAISKLFPALVGQILSTTVVSFIPSLTKYYAQQNMKAFVKETKFAMKTTGMILNIPICLTICFGDTIIALLFPSVDVNLVYKLAIISILHWSIIGPASIIHNIFTVINRIKTNSLLICFTGSLNILLVYILLKFTKLGIYSVVICSITLSILRNIIYTVPYGAIYIKEKWNTFYPEVIKATLSVIFISAIGIGIRSFGYTPTWKCLVIYSALLVSIAILINFFVIFDANERSKIVNLIKSKLNKVMNMNNNI